MAETEFKDKIEAFEKWRSDIYRTVENLGPWLKKHHMETEQSEQSEQKIKRTLEALASDRLSIAFVAEFSRGKTELINSIFFADYGKRLLPSSAGRTTMCPTELFFDDNKKSYVRLLPIETRFRDTPLNAYKQDERYWVNIPLELDSPEQMESAFSEIVQTKKVSVEEAGRLGLYTDELHPHQQSPEGRVEIPKWRHALISYPHPLLKNGLTILDTPGLNALGSEPELTLNLLPQAQAVLFVLSADTGVTRTDLEMWQHHIKGFQASRQRGLVVVLNKIDTLWDELNDNHDIKEEIDNQCQTTSKILGIRSDAIFPVSAQKGLLAKIRKDDALLQRSALLKLEDYLARNILGEKQRIIIDTVTSDISLMIDQARGIIGARLANAKKQMDELEGLGGKSKEVIIHMMDTSRAEQAQYMKNVDEFQSSKRKLAKQAAVLLNALDIERLDRMIAQAQKEMSGSWTTAGLKKVMRVLFFDIREKMQIVVDQSEETRRLIRAIYQKFQREHEFPPIQPKMFSVMKYRVDLELLHQEAEIFRKSTLTTMTEQTFLIKKFVSTIVDRARNIFIQAHSEADTWLNSTLEPLAHQVRDHKLMMEKRLSSLKKIHQSESMLQSRVNELQEQYTLSARQLTTLRNMHQTLSSSRPLTEEERPKPALVLNKKKVSSG
ncbi:MAG: dynamin family protein [gamma proteobacterium symbiont of Bathyaustriella thionipta]|nr:dynamin family protein [gamma proteobacterium symbiont of Bathyaustriella thionipta]